MPKQSTVKRAQAKKRAGRSASTQAGEFVREEIEDIRKGKHGARSAKQAIAIGLSKARQAGVKLPPRPNSQDRVATASGINGRRKKPSRRRSQAILNVLKKEPRSAVSHRSLSRQSKSAAKKRSPEARHRAAVKAVRTKGPSALKAAGKKAARTRAQHATHS